MKNNGLKKYLYLSLTGFGSIALSVIFFFCFYRADRFVGFLRNISNILMPFVFGCIIAYLLSPICGFFEKKLWKYFSLKAKNNKRTGKIVVFISICISVSLALMAFAALFNMVLPQVWESIVNVVDGMPNTMERFFVWTDELMMKHPDLTAQFEQVWEHYFEIFNVWVKNDFMQTAQMFVTDFSMRIMGVLGFLKNLLLGIVVSVYLLASRSLFAAQAKKTTYGLFDEKTANGIVKQVRFMNSVFGGFIRGKLLDSLIIGIICFAVCSAMKMPYTMLVSVIVGVTNVIPFFGPFIGAIPSVILILTVSLEQSIYFVIFVILLQQFDGNILGPKILGQTTGISGFWVLFSILFFGGLWGPLGMIVGVPLFAVIYTAFSRFIKARLRNKNLSEDTKDYGDLRKIENGVYENTEIEK